MIKHLFAGGRGKEAQGNLVAFDGYFSDLKEMIRILNNEMFTKLLFLILAGMILLFVLNYVKGQRISKEYLNKMI